jgi:hypothetical protein
MLLRRVVSRRRGGLILMRWWAIRLNLEGGRKVRNSGRMWWRMMAGWGDELGIGAEESKNWVDELEDSVGGLGDGDDDLVDLGRELDGWCSELEDWVDEQDSTDDEHW